MLKKLHGTKSNESDDDEDAPYRRGLHHTEAQMRLEQDIPQLGIAAIMKRPSCRRKLSIILFFFCFPQLAANIPLQNYQAILYQSLSLTGRMPLLLVGVWGTLDTTFASKVPGSSISLVGASLSASVTWSGSCKSDG